MQLICEKVVIKPGKRPTDCENVAVWLSPPSKLLISGMQFRVCDSCKNKMLGILDKSGRPVYLAEEFVRL